MTMRALRLAAAAAVAVAAAGCVQALQTVDTAAALYNNARAGAVLYHAGDMAKSLQDQPALFTAYDRVRVEARLAPRGEDPQRVAEAFQRNLAYTVAAELDEAGLPAHVCLENCAGRVMTVQFVEKGYDANLFQRVTLGDKLRGALHYVDGEAGSVLRTETLESVETYAELAGLIRMSVAAKVARTLQEANGDVEAVSAYWKGVGGRPAVRPEFREALAGR